MPDPQASLFSLDVGGDSPETSTLKIAGHKIEDLLREWKRGDVFEIEAKVIITGIHFKGEERIHEGEMHFVTMKDGSSFQEMPGKAATTAEEPEDEPAGLPEGTIEGEAEEEPEDATVVDDDAPADPDQPEPGVGVDQEGEGPQAGSDNLDWE